MRPAPAAVLDPLEDFAEHVRAEIGVCTLAISAFDRTGNELRTLVNTGILGPGEERRPAYERYPLRLFPAAAALVHERSPYVVSSAEPGDPASHTLAVALMKTSQSAAPIVVDGEVWGELWAGSTADGLPLTTCELPLVSWSAERVARLLPDLLADDATQLFAASTVPQLRKYELWIDGRLGSLASMFVAGSTRFADGFTVATVVLDRRELVTVLLRLHALRVSLAAVRMPDRDAPDGPPVPAARTTASHVYELRIGGRLDELDLQLTWDCSIGRAGGVTLVTALLDRDGLSGLLQAIADAEADLLALQRLS